MEGEVVTGSMEEFNSWGVVSVISQKQNNLERFILKLVFTPNGEVRFLPKTATGIDFAYAINPRLGADSTGIKIDGKISPISAVLPNAATIEVLVGEPKRAPAKEYLNYCLPQTSRLIKEQLNLAEREELIIKGRKKIEPVLSKFGILVLEDLGECLNSLLYWYGSQSANDMYFKIGRGGLTKKTVYDWLKDHNPHNNHSKISSIRISGKDRPGILSDVASEVTTLGGNISKISQNNESEIFHLRFVIENLDKEAKTTLAAKLSKDKRFTEFKIV